MRLSELFALTPEDKRNAVTSFRKRNLEEFEAYLEGSDWRTRENSNIENTYDALRHHLASLAVAEIGLEKLPKSISFAHRTGWFHLHDLGMIGHGMIRYCAAVGLRQLIAKGMHPNTRIAAKPAKHLSSLINQLINYFTILSHEVAGATAVNSLDVLCAPFIREDRLYYKELLGLSEEQSWKFIERYTEQCVQELIFHLNYSNRSGGQAIFSNVMLELSLKNSDLKNEYCVVGGKQLSYKYGELQKEVDLFNRKFIEVMLKGDGKGQPFTFPLVTITLSPSFDSEISEELKSLIARASVELGLFYFQNCINGVMAKNKRILPNQIRSSCCRLFNDTHEVQMKIGGQFGAGDNTGSLSVVTLNLPRYGYVANKLKGDKWENFYEILDSMLELAKKALLVRRENIIKYRKMGLTPLTDIYDRPNFETYFLTFGIVGLHECLINLGFEDGVLDVEDESHPAYRIVSYIFDRIQEFQKEQGLLMNLEYVPAEGCSYRLAMLDKKFFPDIYTSGEEAPFYSNSVLPPADKQGNLYDLIRISEVLIPVANGGSVVHVYSNEEMDEKAFWSFIKLMTSTRIPYFTLTRIISYCRNCGAYVDPDLRDHCPNCSSEVTKMTRVIGYLRPIERFNVGKKEEFRIRVLTKIENGL